jgi:hypothetical protein
MLRADTHITDWLQLIRAEYLEIPGLSLTTQQVQRLWGLDLVTTEAVLAALVERHVSEMHPPPGLRARGRRLMGTRPSGLARWASLNDRLRRMEWLVLWLVVKHGIRLWLTAPASHQQ